MYKLVAIDLDGTLVTDDKKLTSRTIISLKKALNKNVKIMITSARSFYRLERYIDELDIRRKNQYTICFNGAMIVENSTNNVLYSKNLDNKEVKENADYITTSNNDDGVSRVIEKFILDK